jgi:hypothetical protein
MLIKRTFVIFSALSILILLPTGVSAASVVINEIAWMGTENSYNDEWIEFYNNTGSPIDLNGWTLKSADGSPEITLEATISANGFYLLERTDDTSVSYVSADQIYTGPLNNTGESLQLLDSLNDLVDQTNCSGGWFAGDNTTKQTMERIDVQANGSDSSNWATSQSAGGTPRAVNSMVYTPQPPPPAPPPPPPEPEPDPSPMPEPDPESEPEQMPEPTEPAPSPIPTPPPQQTQEEQQSSSQNAQTIYASGIIINELLPSPEGPDEKNEWIEIFNQNSFEVNLAGWKMSDTSGASKTYIFPSGSFIKARDFLVLLRPEIKITLNNDLDTISLVRPDDIIIDSVTYKTAPTGQSYNLINNQWSWSTNQTPGSSNRIASINEAKDDISENTEVNKDQLSKEAALTESVQNLAAINPPDTDMVRIKFIDVLFFAVLVAIISVGLIILLKKFIKKSKIDIYTEIS